MTNNEMTTFYNRIENQNEKANKTHLITKRSFVSIRDQFVLRIENKMQDEAT